MDLCIKIVAPETHARLTYFSSPCMPMSTSRQVSRRQGKAWWE